MMLETDPVWSAVPYPALILDAKGVIVSCNTAHEDLFAMSLRHMRGKKLENFVGQDSAILESIAQTRRGSASVVQYNVELSWSDRPPRTFTLHASAVQDGGGYTLVLLHPTGMAEQMDRSLSHRSAARSVTGMAAMLAHEIRNPLAGISGAAQLLAMSLDEADQELTELICEETRRIGNLVERVEQFGDLRPTVRKPVNIHDVLDRAKRAALAGFARHVRFHETYDPSLPHTAGDFDQLLQVIQNLLKNAAEATPQVGGIIRMRTGYMPGVKLSVPGRKPEGLPLMISIVDNGSGIPENLIRDIFDPFVSSKTNGSGLGLSLVSKVLTDHGGVVEVDSVPGRTEFRIRLPIWAGPVEEPEPGFASAPQTASGTGSGPLSGTAPLRETGSLPEAGPRNGAGPEKEVGPEKEAGHRNDTGFQQETGLRQETGFRQETGRVAETRPVQETGQAHAYGRTEPHEAAQPGDREQEDPRWKEL